MTTENKQPPSFVEAVEPAAARIASMSADFAALSALYEVACTERDALRKDAEVARETILTARDLLMWSITLTTMALAGDKTGDAAVSFEKSFKPRVAAFRERTKRNAALAAQAGEVKS